MSLAEQQFALRKFCAKNEAIWSIFDWKLKLLQFESKNAKFKNSETELTIAEAWILQKVI